MGADGGEVHSHHTSTMSDYNLAANSISEHDAQKKVKGGLRKPEELKLHCVVQKIAQSARSGIDRNVQIFLLFDLENISRSIALDANNETYVQMPVPRRSIQPACTHACVPAPK